MSIVWRILRWAVVIIAVIFLARLAHEFGNWLTSQVEMKITPDNQNAVFGATIVAIILYALLIAIPFVPGVEIGIGLLVMFGASMAIPVYLATVTGLTFAFLAGRLVPERVICGCFDFLGMQRVSHILRDTARKPVQERLAFLVDKAPTRIVPFLLHNRYIAIALAFNIPGNAIVGGGGGIAFAAGTTRLFSFPLYLLAVAIGVSPVTIIVLLTGNATIFS